ncbi:MAG: hypothetical protein U0528_10205 [Anaerolineae bacterium]|nr:hypothetical protein [Anaerolineae bacterium]
MRKQRKVRIQFSTYLDPDNPVHAPMIEFLEDQSEKRNISSIICNALIDYLPSLGVKVPKSDEMDSPRAVSAKR